MRKLMCPFCAENLGIEREATWLLPQSTDAGKTITYVLACEGHHEGWWDGADWDGSGLERRLATPRKLAQKAS